MAEHPAGHLVLKWLIEQDVTLAEAGKEGDFTYGSTLFFFPPCATQFIFFSICRHEGCKVCLR